MKLALLPFLCAAGLTTFFAACSNEEETTPVGSPTALANQPTPMLNPSLIATLTSAPSRIFFQREMELWSVNPDGSDPLLLSTELAGYSGIRVTGSTAPVGSLAGDRVAFVSDRNLWIVDSVGGNRRQLSDEGQPEDERYAASFVLISGWSPDGTKILYYVESSIAFEDKGGGAEERPQKGFHLVDANSGERAPLSDLQNFVAWSEDSNKIIYEREYDFGSSRDWYELDLTTQVSSKLTAERFDCANVQPTFPLSSNKLLYACGSSNITESSLVLANLDNTNRQVLRQGKWAEFQFPILSPAGDMFVYQQQSDVMAGGKVVFDLQLFDLATGQATQLASGCVRAKGWIDNDTLLFLNDEDESYSDKATLYKVDVATGVLTRLAESVDWN